MGWRPRPAQYCSMWMASTTSALDSSRCLPLSTAIRRASSAWCFRTCWTQVSTTSARRTQDHFKWFPQVPRASLAASTARSRLSTSVTGTAPMTDWSDGLSTASSCRWGFHSPAMYSLPSRVRGSIDCLSMADVSGRPPVAITRPDRGCWASRPWAIPVGPRGHIQWRGNFRFARHSIAVAGPIDRPFPRLHNRCFPADTSGNGGTSGVRFQGLSAFLAESRRDPLLLTNQPAKSRPTAENPG